jgi:hypothetical protein
MLDAKGEDMVRGALTLWVLIFWWLAMGLPRGALLA